MTAAFHAGLPRQACSRTGWHLPHSYFSLDRGWLFCEPPAAPAAEVATARFVEQALGVDLAPWQTEALARALNTKRERGRA